MSDQNTELLMLMLAELRGLRADAARARYDCGVLLAVFVALACVSACLLWR